MKNQTFKLLFYFLLTIWLIGAIMYPNMLTQSNAYGYIMYVLPIIFSLSLSQMGLDRFKSITLVILSGLVPVVEAIWYNYFLTNTPVNIMDLKIYRSLCFNMFGLKGYIITVFIIPTFFGVVSGYFSDNNKKDDSNEKTN